jgi:hypothetical protein
VDADRLARRGVALTTWGLAAWTGLALVGWLALAFLRAKLRVAPSYAAVRDLRDTMDLVNTGRTGAALLTLVLVGLGLLLLARSDRVRAARPAVYAAIAAAGALMAWWIVWLLLRHLLQPKFSVETVRTIVGVRLVLVCLLWLTIIYAIARIGFERDGRTHLGMAGAAAALVLWRFGLPIWFGLTRSPIITDSHPYLWLIFEALASLAALGFLIALSRHAGRAIDGADGPPGAPSWRESGVGLWLTASAIVARVLLIVASLVGIVIIPIAVAFGLERVVLFGWVAAIALTSMVTCLGLYRAARAPDLAAARTAAAALVCFLLSLAFEGHMVHQSLLFPQLATISGVVQLLGLLLLIGFVRQVARQLGRSDLAARGAKLHAAVLIIVGGCALLGRWTAGQAISLDIGVLIFFFLAIVSLVILLTVTKTAHQLAETMREGGGAPVAIARRSSDS